ncbi:HAD family hydrolase [Kribbella sp. CA-294648]|uniref:HAD family hydrolase n=1 Tax=Kribbella sp. CA-294648 TaxID=3239948 RepID=UPI003D8E7671
MERMREYLSAMCTGWDVQTVRAIVADTLDHIVDPMIYDEAVTLIEQHRAAGLDIVIVSSSGAEVVEPIGAKLGADKVIATRMVVADGKYTGEISEYAYGPHKATAITALAAAEGYDLQASYAYSDSITDEPMLAAVGHPYAVNPDKALRRLAITRDWPVLDFSRPVALAERSRFREVRRPAVAAGILGTVAAVAGVLLYAARRRARPEAS